MLDAEYGAHPTHCCLRHGCKYGSPTCPVDKGLVRQKFPCERCLSVNDALENVETALVELGWSAFLAKILIKEDNG